MRRPLERSRQQHAHERSVSPLFASQLVPTYHHHTFTFTFRQLVGVDISNRSGGVRLAILATTRPGSFTFSVRRIASKRRRWTSKSCSWRSSSAASSGSASSRPSARRYTSRALFCRPGEPRRLQPTPRCPQVPAHAAARRKAWEGSPVQRTHFVRSRVLARRAGPSTLGASHPQNSPSGPACPSVAPTKAPFAGLRPNAGSHQACNVPPRRPEGMRWAARCSAAWPSPRTAAWWPSAAARRRRGAPWSRSGTSSEARGSAPSGLRARLRGCRSGARRRAESPLARRGRPRGVATASPAHRCKLLA